MEANKLISTIVSSLILAGNLAGQKGEFPCSTPIDTVACQGNPGQTYSLYLPSKRDQIPALLVFLEPGARGKLPVGLYRDLSERYNLILACSNNGKNGPEYLYRDALDAMIPDLIRRIPSDTSRLILAGFSGGARYASVYSSQRMKTGVIACGAGFSPYGGKEQMNLPYYTGIAGRMDMNFIDVISSVQNAQIAGTPTWMITNGSGHFWPDTGSFRKALDQVRVYWHTHGLLEVPADELERIRMDMYAQFDSLLQANRIYEIKLMETNFRSHPLFHEGDREWLEMADRIPSGYAKKKTEKEWMNIQKREMDYLDSIQTAIEGINYALYNQIDRMRPASWWKQRRKQVDRLMNSTDAILSESGNRMFDYTWRSCWSWGTTHLGDPLEPEQAARYFSAWCSFDPENPTAFYLMAASCSLSGLEQKALKSLETAVKNGFSRADLIEKSDAFDSIRDTEKYLELIEQIKSQELKE